MEAGRRISYLTSEIDAAYHEAALGLGLSDSAMRVLYTLCLNGASCPLSEIISLSGISKQTINSALRKLEDAGMIYLETTGGRKKSVGLTALGSTLAQNTVLRVLGIEDEIFSAWSKAELETYISLTERYLSAFREKVRELTA